MTTPPRSRTHRGGVLLEVLLAVGLFIGAAAFALSSSKQTLDTIERSRKSLAALDLARSKLAELEAGLISLEELRAGNIDEVGSVTLEEFDAPARSAPAWDFDIKTQRTEFRGLTLVQLTVTERPPEGAALDRASSLASATLRQLMPLRDPDAEQYEVDDLIEGLPEAESPAERDPRPDDNRTSVSDRSARDPLEDLP